MLLELHAHTSKYSRCSTIAPLELVRGVVRKKLQGLVITEHHYLWSEEELQALRLEAGIEEHFLIFAGQEVETDIGHIIVFGARETIAKPQMLSKLRAAFPEAALVWVHPLRNGKIPTQKQLCNPLIDAVEIFSSNHSIQENYAGLNLWHTYKFTAFAGSDCHAPDTIGSLPTLFLHPVATIDDVAAEITHGRCHPFVKEIAKSGSNLSVSEVVFGTKGEDESRNRIVVKRIHNVKKFEKKKHVLAIIESLRTQGFHDKALRIPRFIAIDEKERAIIEEGQRGKTLAELLSTVSRTVGIRYFSLAARWLAQLHRAGVRATSLEDACTREAERFDSYRRAFQKVPSLYKKHAKGLIRFVEEEELALFAQQSDRCIQCHGDFHPKNIIIGQDQTHDISTLFISVIDFDSTQLMPASFDVGYFLAQFHNQLPYLAKRYTETRFLKSYAKAYGKLDRTFLRSVELFKVRTALSIGAFLVKVGKGVGPDMDRIMRYAKRARANLT